MTTIEPFCLDDLFDANLINLDPLTENFGIESYTNCIINFPGLFFVAKSIHGVPIGYIFGTKDFNEESYGHVSALSVASSFRHLGIAKSLMKMFEQASKEIFDGAFVDLFVRSSNTVAIQMYQKLGYYKDECIEGYYNDENGTEDGYVFKKLLPKNQK